MIVNLIICQQEEIIFTEQFNDIMLHGLWVVMFFKPFSFISPTVAFGYQIAKLAIGFRECTHQKKTKIKPCLCFPFLRNNLFRGGWGGWLGVLSV